MPKPPLIVPVFAILTVIISSPSSPYAAPELRIISSLPSPPWATPFPFMVILSFPP